MSNRRSSAALRVRSAILQPAEITERLGISPSDSVSKDQPISSRPGSALRGISTWLLKSSRPAEEDLDAHIVDLLDVVLPHRERFLALREQCDVDIFCGYFCSSDSQGSIIFDRSLLTRLAEMDVDVIFDVYGCDDG
jgi:hypothetical protein